MRLLVGDIGGTNTRLATYDGQTLSNLRRWRNRSLGSLDEAIEAYMAEELPFDAACLGVAGPVQHGRAPMMNYPWVIHQAQMTRLIGAPTRLVNDFHAQALAIPTLDGSDVEPLDQLPDGPADNLVVLGPGTGFGEAILTRTSHGWHVVAGEGSHGRFAPQNERQVGLWRFLSRRYPDHVSVERVVSGPGIVNIYEFVTENLPQDPRVSGPDKAAQITQLAIEGRCAHCVEAVEIFVDVFADEAATMSLKCLADRVYLAGGIPPKILPFLRARFRAAFENKGRYRTIQQAVGIRVVHHADPGLVGAGIGALAYAQLNDSA
ncbi:MAG: glucokinase [Myxococcota bacterium]|nr:glucokinase [Myxococcota bacterium]